MLSLFSFRFFAGLAMASNFQGSKDLVVSYSTMLNNYRITLNIIIV